MKGLTLVSGMSLILLSAGCVASAHKITLSAALKEVIDSVQTMHDRQQYLESQNVNYKKLGVYPKEIDVTFNISASGDVSAEGDLSAPIDVAKAGLKVAGDYKSARGNSITIKFASLLDNDAVTNGRANYNRKGQLVITEKQSTPTATPATGSPGATPPPIASASPTPKPASSTHVFDPSQKGPWLFQQKPPYYAPHPTSTP